MPAEERVLAHVRTALGLPEAETDAERWQVPGLQLEPDALLRQGEDVYIVEVKAGRADRDALGRLSLYRDVLTRAENLDEEKVHVVLATKNAPGGVREALETIGGHLVELPPGLALQGADPSVPLGKTQVTTPKAWRVVCSLLQQPVPSINQLHETADVSYGWTHRTVKNLEELGVLGREDGLLTVTDTAKLVNGVAWERPLRALETTRLDTGFETVEQGAREVTRALDRSGTEFAFTAHTAGALYTGYGFRSDTMYLYTDDPGVLGDLVGEGDGPTMVVYEPDRTLEDTEVLEEIRLASRCQTLLDLAGMGARSGGMRKAMVENLA